MNTMKETDFNSWLKGSFDKSGKCSDPGIGQIFQG